MGSKREEERNEKIIRGLMKLPPNRRCVNCNSLGPQYVCTTFWTFICMACSGIHREFTHRVKSVSMSKFTSQEVEVLQTGGNQRAREIYLKNWDHQRQRLPENSNAERVREFIRNVYVQKKYAGATVTDKPPNDSQSHGSSEDMTQRANSYHSYSQSPPYDYQYEERRYGKLPLGFTGKSASVKGLHSKASSFVYSPGRFSDHMFEDQFSNEGSAPRASDFSVSSGGDPFRSEIQSPNSQQEIKFRSPPFQLSNPPQSENLFPGKPYQRTMSSGSVRSIESNSMSIKSYTSSGLGEGVSENSQNTGSQQIKTSTLPPSVAESAKAPIDLFQLPGAPMAQAVNTLKPSIRAGSPPVNLHQAPLVNLHQTPPVNIHQPLPVNLHQPPQIHSSTPTDLFSGVLVQQPTSIPPHPSASMNQGWASFDNPTPAAKFTDIVTSSGIPELEVKIEEIQEPSTSMQWPHYPSTVEERALPVSSPWQDDRADVLKNVASNAPWNAFPDSVDANPLDSAIHIHQHGSSISSTNTDQQHLESQLVEVVTSSLHMSPLIDLNLQSQEEAWQHVNNQKSANPFDFPYDSEFDSNDMFLDMSSLQGELPDIPPFLNGVSQPWLAADSIHSYIPDTADAQGGLACMAGQASTSQLQNSAAQGHVASSGGNPFA
ncbi:unnamed protein product [Cochlearia groenlandica]